MTQEKAVHDLSLLYSATLFFSKRVALNVSNARQSDKSKFSSLKFKKTIYFSLVHPILEFRPFLHNCLRLSDIMKVDSNLRNFIKCVISPSSPQHNHVNQCQILEIYSFWIRIYTLSLCFFYKNVHRQSYSSLNTLSFRPRIFDIRSQTIMILARTMPT